eukprot:2347529-Alexandrium_andersonii.AAC.1
MCIRDSPLASPPGAGGAALRTAPPALGPAEWGSPTFADSKPRSGKFGLSGVLGPRPSPALFSAPSSL